MQTLTSANSVIMLSVAGVYPVAQQLQGFATDDAYSAADVSPAEAVMGVDGKLSGGYTPYPTVFDVTLQADSDSHVVFDTWVSAQNAAREIFIAGITLIIPGTGQKFAMTRGILTTASPLPNGKKILQPRKWTITFQSCSPAPF